MKKPAKHIDNDTRDGVASLPEMEDLERELLYKRQPEPDGIPDGPMAAATGGAPDPRQRC